MAFVTCDGFSETLLHAAPLDPHRRLRRISGHLFTFVDYPQISFENNDAERMIHPAVILRKNCRANRSGRGSLTHAALMSIYCTLRLRGHAPLTTISLALRTYLQTGPPLRAANIGKE
ncbi:MAG TPA: transposase [Vicinamibacterales bacterium]|nr:transposase [Vicinamibacterales bacterium]